MLGVLLEPGYAFRDGRIVSERTSAHVASFIIDGKARAVVSLGAAEHFALPRLRPMAGAGDSLGVTDVDVYLGWFGRASRAVSYASVLNAPMGRLPGARGALAAAARRVQRGRVAPGNPSPIGSDVVAVAAGVAWWTRPPSRAERRVRERMVRAVNLAACSLAGWLSCSLRALLRCPLADGLLNPPRRRG